jgi:hypothetical protein
MGSSSFDQMLPAGSNLAARFRSPIFSKAGRQDATCMLNGMELFVL